VVTAIPIPGWSFLNWFGDASGINPIINISVTRNKYVQAVFGTLLTNSVFMSLYPQADFYPYGTTVKLTALPPNGTYFVSWSGDASGTNNPLSITITNPNQNFSYQLGTLSAGQFALTVIEDGRGHIGFNPLANYYISGQTVALTATPDVGVLLMRHPAAAFLHANRQVSGIRPFGSKVKPAGKYSRDFV
jgi:hypothetical protein